MRHNVVDTVFCCIFTALFVGVVVGLTCGINCYDWGRMDTLREAVRAGAAKWERKPDGSPQHAWYGEPVDPPQH